MFGRLLLLFVFLPMIELYLLIMLGARIGPMPTIGLIFVSILIFGVLISTIVTNFSVGKYLKMNENDLYQ